MSHLIVANAYNEGFKDGRTDERAKQQIECTDCVRQICAADEDRIRSNERAKVLKDLYASDKSSTLKELLDFARNNAEKDLMKWLTEIDFLKLSVADCLYCRYKDSDCDGNCYDAILERYHKQKDK